MGGWVRQKAQDTRLKTQGKGGEDGLRVDGWMGKTKGARRKTQDSRKRL